jgi:glycosyltransferase involved in cell wall biosynthesis
MEVSVYYLKGSPELSAEFEALGVSCHRLLTGKGLMSFFKILVKRRKVLFHAHLPRAELVATVLGIIFRVRVIVSKHNSEQFAPHVRKKASNFLASFVNKHASAIVFISEAAKNWAIRNGELDQSCFSRTHVIHYGVPPIPSVTSLKERNNSLKGEILRIGTLSRLENQKNIGILIDACSILREKGIPFLCEIYGRGSLEKNLQKQIDDFGLQHNVKLMGFTHDKYNTLVGFDIFVLTSNYEGFGLVLLEAMNVGVTIVASNSDAAIEVLGPNSPGLFELNNPFSLCDKILEVAFDEKIKKRIVKNYKRRLELFSVENMFKQIETLYSN